MGENISSKIRHGEEVKSGQKYGRTVDLNRKKGCFSVKLLSSQPIYKPGDVAYFQILGFDPITREFTNFLSTLQNPQYTELVMKITDGKGSCIHTQTRNLSYLPHGELDLLQEVLSYRISSEAAGGIYKASITMKEVEPDEFPQVDRIFRVREYFKKAISLEVDLDKESYFPGDLLYAKVIVRKPDSSPFSPAATISYVARVYIQYIYIYRLGEW